MLMTLLVISLVASLALGGVYNLTKDPIAAADKAKQEAAIKEVVPEFDSLVMMKKISPDSPDSLIVVCVFRQGVKVGTAVETFSKKGYDSTPIKLMVGILPDHSINNIAVIQQKETPGLGTKMKDSKFKDQFNGKNPGVFRMKVKKDGGEVDAISAATVSSRAFCDAVARAYETIKEAEEVQ